MNFPNKHPLNHTEIAGPTLRAADLVLALEARDLFGMVNNLADTVERNAVSRLRPQTRVVRLGTTTLSQRSNYGASQRYAAADIEISASAEATLPYLTEAVKRGAKASFRTRGERLRMATSGLAEATRVEAARAWEASPISTARLAAELWDQIKNDEYTIATECQFQSYWPNRLWTMNHYYNYLGTSGGFWRRLQRAVRRRRGARQSRSRPFDHRYCRRRRLHDAARRHLGLPRIIRFPF